MKDTCFWFIVAAFSCGIGAGILLTHEAWERKTVEAGCAVYDSQTGDWRFKEPGEK